jgi:hypothetical protein
MSGEGRAPNRDHLIVLVLYGSLHSTAVFVNVRETTFIAYHLDFEAESAVRVLRKIGRASCVREGNGGTISTAHERFAREGYFDVA